LNPTVRRAAQLVSSGQIGRPLNARIVSTNIGFGPESPSSYDYFNKSSSGANLLTINGGHTLDVVEAVLGPIIEIDARTEIFWPAVKLTDTGEESVRETADHFARFGKDAIWRRIHGRDLRWCSTAGYSLQLRNQRIGGMAQADEFSPLQLPG
jgi:predicted dehydrogenase